MGIRARGSLPAFILLLCLGAAACGPAGSGMRFPSGHQATHWAPTPGTRIRVQLQGTPDLSMPADAYDFDAVDVDANTVALVHARRAHALCYIDAGTWENWRPDARAYPSSVLGAGDGWPGERWVDVRRWDVLGPIMTARIRHCANKGFDAVDFDNVNGYTTTTGFPLTASDQLTFNKHLASAAHAAGLAAALKNDGDQVQELVRSFDLAIDEQCVWYGECSLYKPFVDAHKAVLDIEYDLAPSTFCRVTTALGIVGIQKHSDLDAWTRTC